MSDTYSANTTSLLHMEGANNSTTFTDSSLLPITFTAYGNAIISTSQSKWNNGSGYFDGTGDYLQAANNIAAFDLSSVSNYTIEAWVYLTEYPSAGAYRTVAAFWTDTPTPKGWRLMLSDTGRLHLGTASTSGGTTTSVVSLNTWTHIAAAMLNGTNKNYIGGVHDGSSGNAVISSHSGMMYVGTTNNSAWFFKGYMQDLRITKGVARYTENFTPPTAKLPDPSNIGHFLQSRLHNDVYDSGFFRISGTVTELGSVGSYRVRLYDRYSGRCVRETWSAADGSYIFNNIAYRLNGYFAIAYDHSDNPLNAAIADLITPEPML